MQQLAPATIESACVSNSIREYIVLELLWGIFDELADEIFRLQLDLIEYIL